MAAGSRISGATGVTLVTGGAATLATLLAANGNVGVTAGGTIDVLANEDLTASAGGTNLSGASLAMAAGSAGYKADTVASNMPINGGLLMFRGSDEKDHTTMLILQGSVAQGENNQRVLTPTGLMLFYVVDAKTPDIYRLPPGSF